MKNCEKRLIWFLGDPSFSDREFSQLANLFSQPSKMDELLNKAYQLRRDSAKRNRIENHEKFHSLDERQYEDELLNHLSQLLLIEARMKVNTALRAIASTTGYDHPLPPSLSFENGIRRIAEVHSPSAILSAATRIRNQVVHSSPKDPSVAWPLKGEE